MSEDFDVRFKEALNVSGAFDNCFFHTYLLHIFANGLDLPEDLFTFESILGDEGHAAKLRKRFPDIDSLSVFAEYAQQQNPKNTSVSPSFIFEKTLVLGFLMREWFATKMAKDPTIAESLEDITITRFAAYKEFRQYSEKDELLSGAEGVLYKANEEFLEYFCQRPKKGNLTANELRFEQYFNANGNENLALKNFWQQEGYKNYCNIIAQPSTKLSYEEIMPAIKMLGQPLAIYNAANGAMIKETPGKDDLPKMETKLAAQEGHYYLLRTDKTKPLLDEYELSAKQYLTEREEVLATRGDKLAAAQDKSSLLVAAIIPSGHLSKAPIDLLIDKVDDINHFVRKNNLIEEQHQKGLLKKQYLEMVEKNGLTIQSVDPGFIRSNTEDYIEILRVAIKNNPRALEYASSQDNYAILNLKNTYASIVSEAVRQDGTAIQFVNRQFVNRTPKEYKKCAIEAVKQSSEALFWIHHDYADRDLKGYKDIALIAVQHHGLAIKDIKDRIFEYTRLDDFEFYKQIVLTAIKQTPEAGQHIKWDYLKKAPVALQAEIIQEAVKHNGLLLEHAARTSVYQYLFGLGLFARVAADAVKQNGLALQFVTDTPFKYQPEYEKIIIAAVTQNGEALSSVHREYIENNILSYQRIVAIAVQNKGLALGSVNEMMYSDKTQQGYDVYKNIVLSAIRNNEGAHKHINWEYIKTAPIEICTEIVRVVEKLKNLDPTVVQPLKNAQQRIHVEEQKRLAEQLRLDELQSKQREAQEESEKQRAEQDKQRVEQEKQRAEQDKQRIEKEKQRAEQDKQRAENEKQREEQEKQRAEQAKQQREEQEKQRVQDEKPAEKSTYHKAFDEAISVLKEKMKEFKDDPNYSKDPELQKAYNATKELHTALEREGNKFFTKEPTLASYTNFKLNCKRHVNDARDVLDHHRGWGKILLNVFAMIITAGIGYAIAAGINIAVNKGKFTFFETDTSAKLSIIEEQIETQANKAAPAA